MIREILELSRRMSNMILPGVVKEVDHEKALVRVQSGDLETEWLPFFQRRTWNTIDWDPPSVGEPCLVLSPGGELAAGFVLAGLYSEAQPAPSQDPNTTMRKFSDEMTYSYDLGTHTLTLTRASGLKLQIKADDVALDVKTASIKNAQGELVALLAEALDIISMSKTPTSNGPQPSTESAAQLPPIVAKLKSFGG